jgi:hypothetical protein
MRRVRLNEIQAELAVAAVPVITVVLAVGVVVHWPSDFEQYMTSACNGMREADAAISSSDRDGVVAGEGEMTALVPAEEQEDAERADLQKVWAGWSAVRDSLERWDQEPGPASAAPSDQPLIDRAVDTCTAYDYSWYSPYRVIAEP